MCSSKVRNKDPSIPGSMLETQPLGPPLALLNSASSVESDILCIRRALGDSSELVVIAAGMSLHSHHI